MNNYDIFIPYGVTVPLQVVSFSVDPPIFEYGVHTETFRLKWEFNRDVESVSILKDGEDTISFTNDPGVVQLTRNYSYDSPSWTLKASVGQYQVSAKTTLSFQFKAYWGIASSAPLDSAGVRALPNAEFITTKTKFNLRFSCTGAERPVFCYPESQGTKKIQVGVIDPREPGVLIWDTFTDYTVSTLIVTNAVGFSEVYNVLIFNTLPTQGYFEVRIS